MNILLGVTGSVAAIKTFKLWDALAEIGDVKGVGTEKGFHFIKSAAQYKSQETLTSLGDLLNEMKKYKITTDAEEWYWQRIGHPILHIDLKDWADILVIAPLSANTMAKMVHGICDNLLTCIYRAWPMDKPIVVAPAMNTDMWKHPLTREHIEILNTRHCSARNFKKNPNPDQKLKPFVENIRHGLGGNYIQANYFHVINPVDAKLACGTEGVGAMASIETIADIVRKHQDEDSP